MSKKGRIKLSSKDEVTLFLDETRQLCEIIRLAQIKIVEITKGWAMTDNPEELKDLLWDDFNEVKTSAFPPTLTLLKRIISKLESQTFQIVSKTQTETEEIEIEEHVVKDESDNEQDNSFDYWHETNPFQDDPLSNPDVLASSIDPLSFSVSDIQTNTSKELQSKKPSTYNAPKRKNKSLTSPSRSPTKTLVLQLTRLTGSDIQKWSQGINPENTKESSKTQAESKQIREFNFRKRKARTGSYKDNTNTANIDSEQYQPSASSESEPDVDEALSEKQATKKPLPKSKPKKQYIYTSYNCKHCQKTFRSSCRRKTHVRRMHSNIKIPDNKEGYRCSFCTCCLVATPKYLIKHIKREHPEQEIQPNAFINLFPYTCKLCDLKFQYKFSRDNHTASHSTDFQFICDECGKGFKALKYLNLHKKLHMGIPLHVCQVCPERFKSVNSRNKHMSLVHPETPFVPRKLSNIRRPFTTPTTPEFEKPFTPKNCEICNKLLNSYDIYRRHMQAHNTACKYCDLVFDNSIDLKTHAKSHPEYKQGNKTDAMNEYSPNRVFKCNMCSMEFSNSYYMQHHKLKVHTGELFKCSCGETIFQSSQELEDHMKEIHPNDETIKSEQYKPEYLCPHCGKLFSNAHKLRIHIKGIHMTEHVKCPKCTRILSADKLEGHMKTHEKWKSGELKHTKYTAENSNIKCEQCGTYYASKSSLAIHNRRVHLNIRNILCSLCPRRFYKKESLAFHLKSHENPNARKKTVKSKPQEEEEDSRKQF